MTLCDFQGVPSWRINIQYLPQGSMYQSHMFGAHHFMDIKMLFSYDSKSMATKDDLIADSLIQVSITPGGLHPFTLCHCVFKIKLDLREYGL